MKERKKAQISNVTTLLSLVVVFVGNWSRKLVLKKTHYQEVIVYEIILDNIIFRFLYLYTYYSTGGCGFVSVLLPLFDALTHMPIKSLSLECFHDGSFFWFYSYFLCAIAERKLLRQWKRKYGSVKGIKVVFEGFSYMYQSHYLTWIRSLSHSLW